MKGNNVYCKLLLKFGILCLISAPAKGQILQCYNDIAPEQLITFLLPSSNFTVTNVQVNGSSSQVGGFILPSLDLGVSFGLLINTGDANISAVGPNLSADAGIVIGNTSTDADLQILLPRAKQFDVATIECDFSTKLSAITFNMVFGSEEYCTSERTGFNDVAGFFISGPNINGPFSNNAINLATPPDGTPLTVQTFNADNNTQRYVANPPPNYTDCGPPAEQGVHEATGYNGFCKPIKAQLTIMPEKVYHLKIAIADIRDGLNDSGLFITTTFEKSYTTTSTCDAIDQPITIFPSPATDVINILSRQTNTMLQAQIQLRDLCGRLLDSKILNPANQPSIQTFDIKQYPPGFYFIHFQNAELNFTCPITKQQ